MTIRAKLLIASMGTVLAVVFMGSLFLFTRRLEANYRKKAVSAATKLEDLKALARDVERQMARVDFFLITRDPHEKEEFESLKRSNQRRISGGAGAPAWKQNYENLLEEGKGLFEAAAKFRPINPGPYNAQAAQLRRILLEHLASQEESLKKEDSAIQEVLERLETFLILIVVFGAFSAVGIHIYIFRSIMRPLALLHEGVTAVGTERKERLIPFTGQDEFGQVSAAFNQMIIRLKELDQMKQDFVSSVTHELRSPLSAGQSLVNVLLGDLGGIRAGAAWQAADIARWKQFLERLRANMDVLNNFVSDMLEMAKIERGKMTCQIQPCSLAPLLEETAQFFQEKSRQKEIRLELSVENGLPEALADAQRIRQVLVNLIDNAIKFTPRGGVVTVTLSPVGGPHSVVAEKSDATERVPPQPESRPSKLVKVSVRDSGIGISPDDQKRIFNKFEQIPGAYRHAEGAKGTGLGLAICKAIIETHGGQLWVESEPGKGSAFAFTLKTA